ncbi:uncharacterized protein BO80DRAFT_272598 [Aspergillus ibericus CBS 121593]|uniref:Uncharacterized protein n=1 Tax=Aspergillus ibericus CBS 121593 TaxID=1448316 RepID=A0A395HAA3_9EURO|nr:hypothetical protein BO80DRAFT_272598 [Aspergillus ibericus CBS 121593]RAL03838.1 hypothetical protein BO80DRAFT_272598 [Aspergillus ibericus CBS 121593]
MILCFVLLPPILFPHVLFYTATILFQHGLVLDVHILRSGGVCLLRLDHVWFGGEIGRLDVEICDMKLLSYWIEPFSPCCNDDVCYTIHFTFKYSQRPLRI